jgi:hypothetical protein
LCDVEREARQQMRDQVSLMGAKLVALPAAKERSMRVSGGRIVVCIVGTVFGRRHHRSAFAGRKA